MKKVLHSPWLGWALLGTTALVLAALFYHFLTPWGAWAFSDSSDYVEAARNFARGWGLTTRVSGGEFRLLTEHAPGYPFMLSWGFRLTKDWVAVTRWEDVLTVAIFALLWGRLFWQITKNPLVGLLAVEFVGITFEFTRAFTSAMSEPWYLVWSTAALILLESDLGAPRWRRTVAAGLFAAFAALTRYAGLHLAAVLFFAYGILAMEAAKRRWGRGVVSAAIPAGAVAAWLVYARVAGGGFAGKFAHTPATILHAAGEYARQFAALIANGYCCPPADKSTTTLVWIAVVMVAALSLYSAWRLSRRGENKRLARGIAMLTLEAFLYPITIGAFFALGNPKPTVDLRMFTPAYFATLGALLLWAVLGVEEASRRLSLPESVHWAFYALVAVAVMLWAYITPFHGKMWAAQIHRYGMGYNQRVWHDWANSDMYRYLQSIPADVLLVTNDWGGLRLWCDHATAAIPRTKGKPIAPFGEGNSQRDRLFREGKAALVLLKPAWKKLASLGDPDEVAKALTKGLHPKYQSAWGAVYLKP